MSFSATRVVYFSVVVLAVSAMAPAARAQYPCASYGYGNYQNQAFYGQPGLALNQGSAYAANYLPYALNNYAPPAGYAASGGYAPPAAYAPPSAIYNQSFYPGSIGYGDAGYGDHHNHHPWHLGHYLLGHH